jgi:hypothetical protein
VTIVVALRRDGSGALNRLGAKTQSAQIAGAPYGKARELQESPKKIERVSLACFALDTT